MGGLQIRCQILSADVRWNIMQRSKQTDENDLGLILDWMSGTVPLDRTGDI